MTKTLQFLRFGDVGKVDRDGARHWIAQAITITSDEMLIRPNTLEKQLQVETLREGIAWANYSAAQMLFQALEHRNRDENRKRCNEWRDIIFSLRCLIRIDARSKRPG